MARVGRENHIGLDVRSAVFPHKGFVSLEVRKINNEKAIRARQRR